MDLILVDTRRFLGPGARERLLMAAVLQSALDDLRDRHGSRRCAEARTWVASDDRTWPYAFVPLCETLGLDPDAVRRQLLGGEGQTHTEPRRAPERPEPARSPVRSPVLASGAA